MLLTSVLVHTYIMVSRAYATGNKLYKDVKGIRADKNISAAKPTSPRTA